jgi:hypothetical protein
MTATPVPVQAAAPDMGEKLLRYLGLDPRNVETQALVLLCERYRLDPLLNHAGVILTKNGPRPYITRDGMLEVAHRSGVFDGITVDEERRSSDGKGFTAYVSVWRKDMSHPFRYGAQCKDDESQAKQGNGPEMALARAERRALRRAFNIPAYGDDSDSGDATGDAIEAGPVTGETGRDRGGSDVTTSTPAAATAERPAPAASSSANQAEAHRVIGAWDVNARTEWLARWDIEEFGEAWPAEAVADALEQPFA